jgi:hypothetical protein
VVAQLLKVGLLLGQLLLELQQLLLLAGTDGVVLAGLLAALERITRYWGSVLAAASLQCRHPDVYGPDRDSPLAATDVADGAGVTLGERGIGRREGTAGGGSGEAADGGLENGLTVHDGWCV